MKISAYVRCCSSPSSLLLGILIVVTTVTLFATPVKAALLKNKKNDVRALQDNNETTTATTATTTPVPGARWMFAARYEPGSNLTAAVESFEKLLDSCPDYIKAGYGYALPGTSSYYTIALFVDNVDSDAVETQAGCMVSTGNAWLTGDTPEDVTNVINIAGGLIDGAEIGIDFTSTDLNDVLTLPGRETAGELVQSYFVRYRDASTRAWAAQRSSRFLNQAASYVTADDVPQTLRVQLNGGTTTFNETLLLKYPNDVHFVASVNYGQSTVVSPSPYQTAFMFNQYITQNPYEYGNNFIPSTKPMELAEVSTIVYKVELFD